MEIIEETEINQIHNICDKKEKKYIKIFGFTIWRLFSYFIIYSFIGFIVETVFCVIKYGVLESRQSFLYGPFCAIYGVGAVIMIIALQWFKKDYNTLFIGGCIVGSVTEYIVSMIGEWILNVKWWDYSQMPFNINGRICLLYSVFWGALGLYLMISLNPKVDKFINYFKKRINAKILKIFVILCILTMVIDCIATAIALSCFTVRTIKEKNIDVINKEYVDIQYEFIYKNKTIVDLINKFFNNEKVLKTFPRLTIEDSQKNIINVRDLYPEINTYFYKLSRVSK